MEFMLLESKELERCKSVVDNINKEDISKTDIDAIYKLAFHYLAKYNDGKQTSDLDMAKKYLEMPYELNKDNLHITSLNIYKYLYEFDEAKEYCIYWQIKEVKQNKSKELYESIAHDCLLLFIKSSFNNERIFKYYDISFSYIKLMIDNNYQMNYALSYLIILYLFNQNDELYNYIFDVCKKYNLDYLKAFAKYVSDEKKQLIENELNNHNMTIHVVKDEDYNYLKLDDFEEYIIDEFVFEVNHILNKEYYNPRKFIRLYDNSNYYEEVFEFKSNMKEIQMYLDKSYTFFNKVYNSLLYKLFLNIIVKYRNNDVVFDLPIMAISNYIYQERFILNERYHLNEINGQEMLFADNEFDYEALYIDIFNILVNEYNYNSAKVYLLIKNYKNNNLSELDNMSKIVKEVFDIESNDSFESSLLMACDNYIFRINLQLAANEYFWYNKYYDEYLLTYKYLLIVLDLFYDEVPSHIYYNIARYYLKSDEERFDPDNGYEYYLKFKNDYDGDYHKYDLENDNLHFILREFLVM